MTTIHELIERVEKLTGPDREVDSAITRSLLRPRDPWPMVTPPYTASFDAVMTLARDQHEFMEILGEAYHKILPPSGSQFAIKYNALRSQMVAQFPAIKAALVCALRARAEQEKV